MRFFLKNANIAYRENVRIGDITGMNQENILPFIVYPDSINSFILLIKELKKRSLSFEVLGGITNTYLCNSFYRDVLIITTKIKDIKYYENTIEVTCGYNLTRLAKELSSKGICGYEGFIGIPGTVGAAALNNSGAFNSNMSKVVKSVQVFNTETEIIENYNNNELKYDTRTSILKGTKHLIILSIIFDTSSHDDIKAINKIIEKNSYYRKTVIDGKRKSLGSVFVSSTLKYLYYNHKIAFTFKKIFNLPLKLIFHNARINTFMDFLFLGKPQLAFHCDSLNRFTWTKKTTEQDFINYIKSMQTLANNKLKLEIEIKK